MASNSTQPSTKPKPKKKSLLGPHSSDDYDYWENFTEKLKLPPALVAKLEENKKYAEEAQNINDTGERLIVDQHVVTSVFPISLFGSMKLLCYHGIVSWVLQIMSSFLIFRKN